MVDIITDTLLDALKLLPFLFVAFLLMEYVEHKMSNRSKQGLKKAGKAGPIIGSLLGAIPQCGFSVAATNLYSTNIITIGTLIAIYLSTSDEMLPILISEHANIGLIVSTILVKIAIGMAIGIIIDLIFKNRRRKNIKDFCKEEHCNCEHGILKSAIRHTINILLFIIVVELILNVAVGYLGSERLEKIFFKNNPLSYFLASLIGLIPNCGASVAITELYLNGAISYGAMLSGLLTGSGIALLVLFKENKNLKENLKILFIIYLVGVGSGMLIDFIAMLF